MLREHLSQEHDLASRRTAEIDSQVEWLNRDILPAHASVLDLGCGPGLYTSRLAALGHSCVGIDFSPSSIEYARAETERASLDCVYMLEDFLRADFGSGFDAVLFLYAEFNTFRPREASQLLGRIRRSLKPGGRLALEVHTEEQVRQLGTAPPSWYVLERGLFADEPHLCLVDCAWDDDARVSAERFTVYRDGSGRPETYVCTTQAYAWPEYQELLASTGFTSVRKRISAADAASPGESGLMVITAAVSVPA